MEKTNFNDYLFVFYGIPFLSNFALLALVAGVNRWGTYRLSMSIGQTRLYGLLTLIICIYMSYVVLIKWPKSYNYPNIAMKVLKMFLSSAFLYLWILTIVLTFIKEIYNESLLVVLYFISLIICAYFQYSFINKIKQILNSKSQ